MLTPRRWEYELDMTYAQRGCELVKGHDRRVPAPVLQAADVLLAEARDIRELFLCQPLLLSDPLA